jgi:hypothetical protein
MSEQDNVNAAQQAADETGFAALEGALDAAVDAEPEVTEPEIVKSTASVTKYKANVGGAIVWAQPIASFGYDKNYGHFITLTDGTNQSRPTLHGYNPMVGDYFVQSYKTTLLGDGRTYVEPAETAIVGKALFESLYTATE